MLDLMPVGFLAVSTVKIAVGMARFVIGLALGLSVVAQEQKLGWW
jgi:hypothetical protein